MTDKQITTGQAAAILGVSTARIRQLIAEGQLTATKLGGRHRGQWLVETREVEQRRQKKGTGGTMKVKHRMTPSPITVSPKTNYNQALRLLRENEVQHLPVVNDRGKLVGIVSDDDLLKAQPSRVTTLSFYEIASLLDQVTMDQIMSKPVFAVEESCSITNAARFMLDNDVGCLPVMRGEELVGIITDTDIFQTFVEVSGGGQAGSRIEVRMPDEKGQLAGIVRSFADSGSYIVSLTITYDEAGQFSYADIKERGGDEQKLKENLKELGTVDIVDFRPSDEDRLLKI
jgi:acetoin utilization protein AcuB